MPEESAKHKITLLGAYGAGKTCLLLRFAEDDFAVSHMPTIGVDYKSKTVRVGATTVRLQIWDSAGQEKFQTIAPNYFRGSQGIVVVYDVTDRLSFERAGWWLKELRSGKFGGEQMDLMLVGNKIDLEGQRAVSDAEGSEMAREYGIVHCEVSAKANLHVAQVFNDLAERIVTRLANTETDTGAQRDTEASMRPYSGAQRGTEGGQRGSGQRGQKASGGFLCCGSRPQT